MKLRDNIQRQNRKCHCEVMLKAQHRCGLRLLASRAKRAGTPAASGSSIQPSVSANEATCILEPAKLPRAVKSGTELFAITRL